jgi:hypothetical protein
LSMRWLSSICPPRFSLWRLLCSRSVMMASYEGVS